MENKKNNLNKKDEIINYLLKKLEKEQMANEQKERIIKVLESTINRLEQVQTLQEQMGLITIIHKPLNPHMKLVKNVLHD